MGLQLSAGPRFPPSVSLHRAAGRPQPLKILERNTALRVADRVGPRAMRAESVIELRDVLSERDSEQLAATSTNNPMPTVLPGRNSEHDTALQVVTLHNTRTREVP